MKKVILATASPYKSQLFEQLKISFTAEDSLFDESLLKNKGLSPMDLSVQLAEKKALLLKEKNPEAIIIGSDQVCWMGSREFSKPGTMEAAKQQLLTLQGQTHTLTTSVCVLTEATIQFTVDAKLRMRHLNPDQIDKYLQIDQPLDCAGSYKLEELGISLFHKIDCEDHTAIIGLPLVKLADYLSELLPY